MQTLDEYIKNNFPEMDPEVREDLLRDFVPSLLDEEVTNFARKEARKRPELEGQPANKGFQIMVLRREFTRLNPEADPAEIDFNSYIDSSLHIPENREKLAEAYPGYRWEDEGDAS